MLGRARGTREGERRTPLLFSHRASSTFLLLSPHPSQQRLLLSLWLATVRGPTLQSLCACQSKKLICRRRTRGWGDKGSLVLHWFFYNEFEDVQEKAPTKVPNHDKLVDTQTTLWASLTIRRTNVHLDSCSLTIAHAVLQGYHCSLLSFGACQSDGMLQN